MAVENAKPGFLDCREWLWRMLTLDCREWLWRVELHLFGVNILIYVNHLRGN
jgi:hypothetical protein